MKGSAMTSSIDQLTDKVFKRTEGNHPTHDMRSFNVLQAIDGRRSVGAIARQEHYELKDLAMVIEQLLNEGAIEPIHADASKTVGKDFFKNMEDQLSRIMGPVSGMIIEEHLAKIGTDTADCPASKAHEIIDLVSRAIPDKRESEGFVRSMTDLLDE